MTAVLSGTPLALPPDWPRFDRAALYGIVGDCVRSIEEETESDPVAILAVLLAISGCAIGPAPHANADASEHPAKVWPTLIGGTADGRKGSATGNAMLFLRRAEPKFMETRIIRGIQSGEMFTDIMADPAPDAPAGSSDGRAVFLEPEYGRFLRAASREGNTLPHIARDAWDGQRIAVRSRSHSAVASRAHAVIVGMITPQEYRKQMTDIEIHAGSTNRTLPILCARQRLLPTGGNVDDERVEFLGRRLGVLIGEARKVSIVRRDPEAEAYWAKLYTEIAKTKRAPIVEAMTARSPAQLLRLSVAYCLLDGENVIRLPHLQAAEALWRYSVASVEYLFADSSESLTVTRIRNALIDAFKTARQGLGRTELRAIFSGHLTSAQLDEALGVLVDAGDVEITSTPTAGRPREVAWITSEGLVRAESDVSEESRDQGERGDSSGPFLAGSAESELNSERNSRSQDSSLTSLTAQEVSG